MRHDPRPTAAPSFRRRAAARNSRQETELLSPRWVALEQSGATSAQYRRGAVHSTPALSGQSRSYPGPVQSVVTAPHQPNCARPAVPAVTTRPYRHPPRPSQTVSLPSGSADLALFFSGIRWIRAGNPGPRPLPTDAQLPQGHTKGFITDPRAGPDPAQRRHPPPGSASRANVPCPRGVNCGAE